MNDIMLTTSIEFDAILQRHLMMRYNYITFSIKSLI